MGLSQKITVILVTLSPVSLDYVHNSLKMPKNQLGFHCVASAKRGALIKWRTRLNFALQSAAREISRHPRDDPTIIKMMY